MICLSYVTQMTVTCPDIVEGVDRLGEDLRGKGMAGIEEVRHFLDTVTAGESNGQ